MRRRRYEMALSDIFGTNLYNILLLSWSTCCTAAVRRSTKGRLSLVGSLLGALLAAIFLVGLIERKDRGRSPAWVSTRCW